MITVMTDELCNAIKEGLYASSIDGTEENVAVVYDSLTKSDVSYLLERRRSLCLE